MTTDFLCLKDDLIYDDRDKHQLDEQRVLFGLIKTNLSAKVPQDDHNRENINDLLANVGKWLREYRELQEADPPSLIFAPQSPLISYRKPSKNNVSTETCRNPEERWPSRFTIIENILIAHRKILNYLLHIIADNIKHSENSRESFKGFVFCINQLLMAANCNSNLACKNLKRLQAENTRMRKRLGDFDNLGDTKKDPDAKDEDLKTKAPKPTKKKSFMVENYPNSVPYENKIIIAEGEVKSVEDILGPNDMVMQTESESSKSDLKKLKGTKSVYANLTNDYDLIVKMKDGCVFCKSTPMQTDSNGGIDLHSNKNESTSADLPKSDHNLPRFKTCIRRGINKCRIFRSYRPKSFFRRTYKSAIKNAKIRKLKLSVLQLNETLRSVKSQLLAKFNITDSSSILENASTEISGSSSRSDHQSQKTQPQKCVVNDTTNESFQKEVIVEQTESSKVIQTLHRALQETEKAKDLEISILKQDLKDLLVQVDERENQFQRLAKKMLEYKVISDERDELLKNCIKIKAPDSKPVLIAKETNQPSRTLISLTNGGDLEIELDTAIKAISDREVMTDAGSDYEAVIDTLTNELLIYKLIDKELNFKNNWNHSEGKKQLNKQFQQLHGHLMSLSSQCAQLKKEKTKHLQIIDELNTKLQAALELSQKYEQEIKMLKLQMKIKDKQINEASVITQDMLNTIKQRRAKCCIPEEVPQMEEVHVQTEIVPMRNDKSINTANDLIYEQDESDNFVKLMQGVTRTTVFEARQFFDPRQYSRNVFETITESDEDNITDGERFVSPKPSATVVDNHMSIRDRIEEKKLLEKIDDLTNEKEIQFGDIENLLRILEEIKTDTCDVVDTSEPSSPTSERRGPTDSAFKKGYKNKIVLRIPNVA